MGLFNNNLFHNDKDVEREAHGMHHGSGLDLSRAFEVAKSLLSLRGVVTALVVLATAGFVIGTFAFGAWEKVVEV